MSSDDSGFDKEAEREKLREKYEQDRKGRENTRRMSELLLQGATMTGKHCNECGDPIFRYDGQEFCPTCQQEVEGGTLESDGTEADRTGADTEETGVTEADETDGGGAKSDETASRETDQTAGSTGLTDESPTESTTDDEPRVEIEGVRVADRHADRSDLRRPPSKRDGDDRRSDDQPHRHSREHGRDGRDGGRSAREPDRTRSAARDATAGESPDGVPGNDAGDLEPAREALVRNLTDLARRAEATDDVAHTRELLAATREAAEALAALDRATQ